jgi:HSP20 family molecular chaperone IbpA
MRHERPDKSSAFNLTVHRNEEDRTIHVTITLDGIAEEQIRFDLEKTTLTLCVTRDSDVVKKTLRVPGGTRFFKKKIHDGILEIILEKPVP